VAVARTRGKVADLAARGVQLCEADHARPEPWARLWPVCSDSCSSQLARIISEVAGTRVTYYYLPVEEYADVLQRAGLDQATARFVAALAFGSAFEIAKIPLRPQ
jgi:hypothetical protein